MTFGKKIERYESCGTYKGDLNPSMKKKTNNRSVEVHYSVGVIGASSVSY